MQQTRELNKTCRSKAWANRDGFTD